ncbi:MAG: outer membrane protein assembly factor BamE [Devosiaceae bacterium]|nr:outer membrane protein assembly factor BamE [Devosiaceae bacterium]
MLAVRNINGRIFSSFTKLAIISIFSLALYGCTGFVNQRTQGYSIPQSAMDQIRPGQSEDLVIAVLGSPQTKSNFAKETAFYYVETKIEETAFGLTTIQSRTVLAIYFDKKRRVTDKAVYSLEDGRIIAIETRRTPSFGEDASFVEALLASI